jgi:hypothetical protein
LQFSTTFAHEQTSRPTMASVLNSSSCLVGPYPSSADAQSLIFRLFIRRLLRCRTDEASPLLPADKQPHPNLACCICLCSTHIHSRSRTVNSGNWRKLIQHAPKVGKERLYKDNALDLETMCNYLVCCVATRFIHIQDASLLDFSDKTRSILLHRCCVVILCN